MTQPFHFGALKILIDNKLSRLVKISELCFPEAEGVGVGGGVTIFKAQNSVFRQVRVRCDEVSDVGLVLSHGVNRNVEAILVLVEAVSVSVREGSSLNILAR